MTAPGIVAEFTLGEYLFEVKETELGHLCGYLTVPPTHPWVGMGYDAVHEKYPHVSVHGGLTFAEGRTFGFDCAHCYDAPRPDHPFVVMNRAKYPALLGHREGTSYKDKDYVICQLLELWCQATDIEVESKP